MVSVDEGKRGGRELTEKMTFGENPEKDDICSVHGEKGKRVHGDAVDRHGLRRVRSVDDLFGRMLADLEAGSGLEEDTYFGGMVEEGGRESGDEDEEDALFLSLSVG